MILPGFACGGALLGAGSGGGGGGLSLSYRSSQMSVASDTTQTFFGMDIGSAAADRIVIVGVGQPALNGHSITGVTIGGIAATLAVQDSTFSNHNDAVYYASVPTGTTADIVVTMDGGNNFVGIFVYALYGAAGTVNASATFYNGVSQLSISTTMTVADNSVVVGFYFSFSNRTLTWTGLSEDAEIYYGGASPHYVQASASAAFATGGSKTFTVTCDSATGNGRLLTANFL